jgi:hypothetical protein
MSQQLAKNRRTNYWSEWHKVPSSYSSEFPKPQSIVTFIDSKTGKEEERRGLSFPAAETSTEQFPVSDQLNDQIESLFSATSEAFFEDEQSWDFSERLSTIVKIYGDTAISSLAPFIIGKQASAELAAETLNCLSHLESRIAYNYRIWLMERALQSPSSWIRDAAALSLESMDDPSAVPYLQEAFNKESNAELRQYMSSILEYLQRKR